MQSKIAGDISEDNEFAAIKLNWMIKPEDIIVRTEELIVKSKAVYDAVGSLQEKPTFDNVIKPLADDDNDFSLGKTNIDFLKEVSPNKEIRDAATEADKRLSEFNIELCMRKDVFDKLVELQLDCNDFDEETKRYLDRKVIMGKRKGLHLEADKRDEIEAIEKEMSNLSIQYNKNVNEENTKLEFSKEELGGMSDDWISSLDRAESGHYVVTLKYPHVFPILKKCCNPKTRETVDRHFKSRCKAGNKEILENLCELRANMAKVLRYETHSDYVTEMLMAKNSRNVSDFLLGLAEKLKPQGEAERREFVALKKAEHERLGLEFDGMLHFFDMKYYANQVEETRFSVDHEELRKYFPIEAVTTGIFTIYETLLGLKFTEIASKQLWHDDVKMYSVHNAGDAAEPIGYFYLDMYPREGKFSHACCCNLQNGCRILSSGTRQTPVSAMLANFTKSTETKPSLLNHLEVVTYVHEFGHLMHQICSLADYSMFAGTNVERDFVEAPSQMLENWAWEKESLSIMSRHYLDGSPIPDDLLAKLIESRLANCGSFNLRQIALAMFDQWIHTSDGTLDVTTTFFKAVDRFIGIAETDETCMPASFAHLAAGYDAQYYGYMWSEVFSMDMFQTKFKDAGMLNPKVGREYRDAVLAWGGARDAAVSLREFLGREPNDKAFLKSKGL